MSSIWDFLDHLADGKASLFLALWLAGAFLKSPADQLIV
jgi:hypothetical protein